MRKRPWSFPPLLACVFCGLAAAAAAHASEESPARRGPLKDLPSPEGEHVEKIRALGDNAWLDLGVVPPDPVWGEGIGRAWCGTMPFAPELRGAFLYGEGRHGGTTERNGKRYYNDDLFFYDINANRWVCVFPGNEVGRYELTANDDGFEVDAEGHPVPLGIFVHSYMMLAYDLDRKLFVHMWSPSGYWREPFPKRAEFLDANAAKMNGIGRSWSKINQASPWMYDTVAGHWKRFKTKARTPGLTHGAHLHYLSAVKKYFILGKDGVSLYDPEANDYQDLKPSGPRPPKPIDAASCYDPKRNRVYVAMGSYPKKDLPDADNHVFAYDAAQNAWIDLKAKGELPPLTPEVSGCGVAKMFYDSANDVLLYFALSCTDPERRGVYAYDFETNTWTRPCKEFPAWGKGGSHTFYDSKLNAVFLYKAADSAGKGTMHVYRYKRGAQE